MSKLGPRITIFVVIPIAVIVIIATLVFGKPTRQIEQTPLATATQSATVVNKPIATVRPTQTPGPTPTLHPTPSGEDGWFEIYDNQVWARQVSPVDGDELPCPTFWFGGRECRGETIEVYTVLSDYYLNVWDSAHKPLASILLEPGTAITYLVPADAELFFGTLPIYP